MKEISRTQKLFQQRRHDSGNLSESLRFDSTVGMNDNRKPRERQILH